MKLRKEDFTRIYKKIFDNDPELQEAYSIIKPNSSGPIRVIGGSVYGKLVEAIYGRSISISDIDFLLDGAPVSGKFDLPGGWRLGFTRYGTPYFFKDKKKIDINYLQNIYSIWRKGISKPSIDDFLEGTPFNVDSILFDCDKKTIEGKLGMKSINEKVIGINNEDTARFNAEVNDTTTGNLLIEKARKLGFDISEKDRMTIIFPLSLKLD